MCKSNLIIFVFCFFMTACGNQAVNENSGSINDVDKQHAAKGEELFKTHCITCHTLRYIDMQPEFPRKTWEKITDKMIKSFGAPIPDSSAVLIVDYLMSIKGKKE